MLIMRQSPVPDLVTRQVGGGHLAPMSDNPRVMTRPGTDNAPQRQLSPDPRVSGQYRHPALVLLWALVTDIFEAMGQARLR